MAEIGINLRADPSQFEAGTKAAQKAMADWQRAAETGADDVAEKLEEVLRTIVTLGTESGKTRATMVDDLRKFGLSAEQAERAVEAVWDEMGEGQRAARDIEKASDALEDVERGADDAADATKRVGDESEKTGGRVSELGNIARDVLEGDFGGAAESAIGALGALGAFAGVGGALAGLLAAGVGEMVGNWVRGWDDAARESEERISTMFNRFLESGSKFLTDEQMNKAISDLADDTEAWTRATEIQAATGLSMQTILRAMVGDQEAIRAAVEAENAEHDKRIEKIQTSSRGEQQIAADILVENQRHAETIGLLQQIGTDTDSAAAKAAAVTAAFATGNAKLDEFNGKLQAAVAKIDAMSTTRTVTLKVDDSALEAAITRQQGRTISVNVHGQITRIGNQVW